MFNNSNLLITGGTFHSIARQKGIELLRERIAPGAFHDSSERYDPPKCHPQTRIAVIKAITSWIEDGQKTSFIKWLYGPAGAGKSAIAQAIAELCHQAGHLAASFFWSRSAAGRNNEERLIASLAYQLLVAIPQMRVHVEESLENDPSLLSRSLATQMESLIIKPLEKVSVHDQQGLVASGNPKLIILDGLDECGTPEAQEYILKVISNSIHQFHVPLIFFIASRPEQAIRDSFDNQPLLSITSRLVLDDRYHPDDDIRLFLVESFESVKRTHIVRSLLPHIWPITEDIDQLVHKSSGQFIYAATIVKFVQSPRRRPDKQLNIVLGISAVGNDTPFAELDALYNQIFGLVEDLPRALEVLSCLFLMGFDSTNSTAGIEAILSYSSGELQLILIDLHSVVDVPAIGDKHSNLCVLHASLQDFLMDPTRSGNFYIDADKAHGCIAQHSLRYIDKYSQDADGSYSWQEVIFNSLSYHCSKSLATRALLTDFFDFNFPKWISTSLTAFSGLWETAICSYLNAVELYGWLYTQEAHIQEFFGPGRSLYAQHSCSWDASVDFMCKEIFCRLLDEYPKHGKNAATATTHPQIVQIVNHCGMHDSAFRQVIGVPFPFVAILSPATKGKEMIYLQQFLCNPKRAGKYCVHGGMYATLSMQILKFIFHFKAFKYKDKSQEKVLLNEAQDTHQEGALQFAIETLPFYLLNADYMPELARHASYLFSHKFETKQDTLHSEIKLLHKSVDQYLMKKPSTLNTMQEQFHRPTLENQLINTEPEENTKTFLPFSERYLLAGKRHRETEEGDKVIKHSHTSTIAIGATEESEECDTDRVSIKKQRLRY